MVFDLFALPLLHHHLHHLPSHRAATLQCLSQSNSTIYPPMKSLELFHAAQTRSQEVGHWDEIQFCTDLVKFCQICIKHMTLSSQCQTSWHPFSARIILFVDRFHAFSDFVHRKVSKLAAVDMQSNSKL